MRELAKNATPGVEIGSFDAFSPKFMSRLLS
jgi:hypothetical protein